MLSRIALVVLASVSLLAPAAAARPSRAIPEYADCGAIPKQYPDRIRACLASLPLRESTD